MEKLGIEIPQFILHRRLVVEMETKGGKGPQLTVYGVDIDGTHVTFLRSVKLEYNRRVLRSEPFVFNLRGELDLEMELKLELEFMGHYGEPNLEIVHDVRDNQTLHLLKYNPQTGEWKTSKETPPTENASASESAIPTAAFIDLTV